MCNVIKQLGLGNLFEYYLCGTVKGVFMKYAEICFY